MKIIGWAVAAVLFGLIAAGGAEAQLTRESFHQAEIAIMSAGSRAAKIARLDHVPSLTVIDLRFRLVPRFQKNAPEPAELEIVAGKYAAGVRRLRDALRGNAAASAALAGRGVAVGRVVGARIFSNGALLVYVM